MNSPNALLSSRLLQAGFRHAFFTRLGGSSPAPFDSLNFSISVGDSPSNVSANLASAASLLGVPAELIFYLDQIHSDFVFPVDRSHYAATFRKRQGDAVVSHDPNVACAARFADCAPVLIADQASGAVVAVHSGWRSTAQNICGAAVRALQNLTGNPLSLIAAVGPHIEACCFEVGDDVARTLQSASPAHDVLRPGKRDRPHVDLRSVIHAQLLAAGVAENAIDHVRGCTVCDGDKFFSYRREGARSGRMMAAIVARNNEVSEAARAS